MKVSSESISSWRKTHIIIIFLESRRNLEEIVLFCPATLSKQGVIIFTLKVKHWDPKQLLAQGHTTWKHSVSELLPPASLLDALHKP